MAAPAEGGLYVPGYGFATRSQQARMAGPAIRAGAPARSRARVTPYDSREMKYVDSDVNFTALTTSWAAYNPATPNCLTAVATGDGEQQHLGRAYTIYSLHVSGYVETDAISTANANQSNAVRVRVAIVQDTQTNATEIVGTTVFDTSYNDQTTAYKNLSNVKRYKVLYDNTIVVDRRNTAVGNASTYTASTNYRPFSFNKTWKKGLKVNTSGTTATVASITDNSVGLIAVASGNSVVKLAYSCRMRFKG